MTWQFVGRPRRAPQATSSVLSKKYVASKSTHFFYREAAEQRRLSTQIRVFLSLPIVQTSLAAFSSFPVSPRRRIPYFRTAGMLHAVEPVAPPKWHEELRSALKMPELLEQLTCDKFGITRSASLTQFGYIDLGTATTSAKSIVRGCDVVEYLTLCNTGEFPISLASARVLDHADIFNVALSTPISLSGAPLRLRIGLHHNNERKLPTSAPIETYLVLIFQFPGVGNLVQFTTHSFVLLHPLRLVPARVGDVESSLDAEASAFVPLGWRQAFSSSPAVVASLPETAWPLTSALSKLVKSIELDYAATPSVPAMVLRTVEMMQPAMLQQLDPYVFKQHTCIQLEEMQMHHDATVYDLHDVRLRVPKAHRHHRSDAMVVTLDVPGIREARPLVGLRDVVRLRPHHAGFAHLEIVGVVAELRTSIVTLVVPTISSDGAHLDLVYQLSPFHVRFMYQRLGFQMVYYALGKLSTEAFALLHPSSPQSLDHAANPKLEMHNPTLNEHQTSAVTRIVARASGAAPYIIFGPPGTGKTVTVIETILQLLATSPSARVLAVAPSDAAADVLATRLRLHLGAKALFRLNWHFRSMASVPAELLGVCFTEGGDIFSLPPLTTLAAFRVVVTTTCASGVLSIAGLAPGHFRDIIIDEACQATEAETLVPLLLYAPGVHVTLVGDPRQLGPQPRSPAAISSGFATSWLERLVNDPTNVYNWNAQRGKFITMLQHNYRSHPALLELPSRLFYRGALVASGNIAKTHALTQWDGLGGRGHFPMVWHSVHGTQHKELDAHSYTNLDEAFKIVQLVESLVTSTSVSVTTADIAVVTPFRRQVVKIRHMLRNRDFGGVNVGTVYNLQGQEAKIVLVSLVRTPSRRNATRIPILSDAKLFNVAVTRAKALLLIVGHPGLLSQQPFWGELLDHCVKQGGFRASPVGDEVGHQSDREDDVVEHYDDGKACNAAVDGPDWRVFL
ncbi:hypothetical protein SDRG_11843 [Saprolegnia diclina VS20]|uniref:Uncharacterized protein n=1 Tax=Saprolegnia diclina (strain VS20) TaxID=1156394 RepID=T0Q7F4_SAPDV|nr:hypothetical protein SDRG_11843 [Saprolegnia diclina VS20]EQC30526.1 hypothetical protein SDRG_11843 [Saprolegnia diclina VS20]|eukprot:XP_008616119.1 hypothetical protein SDRG_11843 [Saprolegnia diclina VS20]